MLKDVRARRLLDSLADITGERDLERFRSSLGNTVREMISVDDVTYVQLTRDEAGAVSFQELRRDREAQRRTLPPPLPEIRPEHVTEMMRSGHHVDVIDGQWTLLLPVVHRDALTEIVIVRAQAVPTDALYLLKGFTRLYRNFLGLILDNERDPLTGLFNRRTLETRLASLTRDAARRNTAGPRTPADRRTPESAPAHYIAMLDLDHFKKINDAFGHLFGDEVLLLASRVMREVFRDQDLLFRYGGEEFAVVLVAQTREGALAAANRFRERVASHRFPQLEQVTVSSGVTAMRPDELPSAAIARADRALYCAKEDGRNRVAEYEALVASGRLGAENAGHAAELF